MTGLNSPIQLKEGRTTYCKGFSSEVQNWNSGYRIFNSLCHF